MAFEARGLSEIRDALRAARGSERLTVIATETDPQVRVAGYESWWDVPPAEVSDRDGPAATRAGIVENARALSSPRDAAGMSAALFGLHAAFTLSDETLSAIVQPWFKVFPLFWVPVILPVVVDYI